MKNAPTKIALWLIACTLLSCSNSTTFTVGGTATGINGNITLQNNGKDDFIITNDVDFIFDTALENGTAYEVTVSKHPTDQTCTVTNGEGTVTEKVTNVTVACTPTSGTLTVNVTHLNGTVDLQNNGGDDLSVDANGNYTFDTSVAVGADYDVTVLNQPTNQTCQITGGSGTMTNSGAEVTIACGKVMFISTALFDGAFGSLTVQITGDHQCDIDAGNPDTSKTYKVLMAGAGRKACTTANCSGGISEHSDWVLTPNTTYVLSDDTVLFTTNSNGIFDFSGSLLNPISSFPVQFYWTGLNPDWTSSANNCLDWQSNANTDLGEIGDSSVTNSNTIDTLSITCDANTNHLLCVEQ